MGRGTSVPPYHLLICQFLKAYHSVFAHPNTLKPGRITNI